MAFDGGAVKAKVILDDSQYQKGAKGVAATNQKLTKGFGLMQIGAAAAATAIVAGFVSSVKKANEFQKAFSNVKTLLDEGVVDSKRMQKELLNLDARLGSSIDLTKGLYQALSASVEPAKAVQFVGESAKFAKAALTDTYTAVDVLTTILNAYGMEAQEVTRVSDVLFQTIKLGKVTGQELSSSLGKVIPTAATLGASVEELGAALAVMTKQGVQSFEAVTQLQAIFNAFIKPSTELEQAFEDFGVASGSALIQAEGLAGALEFLEKATGGNLEKMGQLLPNIRGMKGTFALTGKQIDNFRAALDAMNNSAGSTNTAFEKQELTFETLGNMIEKMQIRIGQAFLPLLYELTQALGVIVEVSKFVAPALAIIFDAMGDFVKNIGTTFVETIKDIASPFLELGNNLKINIPFLEIFAGVLELVRINIAVMIKGLKFLIIPFVNLVRVAKEAITALVNFGKILLNPTKWKEVGNVIKDLGKGIADIAKDTIEDAADIGRTIVQGYGDLVLKSKERAKEWKGIWKEATEEVGGDIQSSVINLGEIVQKQTEKTKKNFTELASSVLGKMQFIMNQVGSIFNSIMGIVNEQLQNELAVLQDKGEQELEELEEQKENRLLNNEDEFNRKREQLEADREAGLISQEEYDAQVNALEAAKATKTTQIEKEMEDKIQAQKDKNRKRENDKEQQIYQAQKANKIATVWMQTAVGIVAAWSQSIAQLGPIAGSIFAGVLTGVMVALAIAQTAVIAQQQFVPARKKGGMAGGITRVGEEGGEIITLPDNSQVIPNDISRQIAMGVGMASGNTINVSFAGAQISDTMSLRKISDWVSRDIAKQLRVAT